MDTRDTPHSFYIISTIRYDPTLLSSWENTIVNLHVGSMVCAIPNQFYMLSYHQERMVASARVFGWDPSPIQGPAGYLRLIRLLHNHLEEKHKMNLGPLMLRIAFSIDGSLTVTSNGPHPPFASVDRYPSPPHIRTALQLFPRNLFTIADPLQGAAYLRWRVFVSFDKITPTLFTRHKTSDRREYDKALALPPAHPKNLTMNGIQLQIEVLIINERSEIMEGCRCTPYFLRGNKWITPAATCGGNLGTTRRWALTNGLCEEGVVKGGNVQYDEIIVLSNGARGFQAGIVRPWTTLTRSEPLQIPFSSRGKY